MKGNNKLTAFFIGLKEDDKKEKALLESLLENSEFLSTGKYRYKWLNEKICVFKEKSDAEKFFWKYSRQVSSSLDAKTRIKQFLRNIVIGNNNKIERIAIDSKKQYEMLLVSVNKSVYYYDLHKGQIIKNYNDRDIDTKYTLLENNGYWNYFNSPVIERNGNQHIEKIVGFKPINKDEKNLNYLLIGYRNYIKGKEAVKKVALKDLLRELDIEEYLSIPACYKTININYYVMHGDLNKWNIIKGFDGKGYIVDYEFADSYPFFYDVFSFCLNFRSKIKIEDKLISFIDSSGNSVESLFRDEELEPNYINIRLAFCITAAIYIKNVISNLQNSEEDTFNIEKKEKKRLNEFICQIKKELGF